MAKVAEPCSTVAEKIRALADAGYALADITRLLGRSYRQVRQVLVDERMRRERQGEGADTGRGPTTANPPSRMPRESAGTTSFRMVVRAFSSFSGSVDQELPRQAVHFARFLASRRSPRSRLTRKCSSPDGQLTIPAAVLHRMGAKGDGVVIGCFQDDEFILLDGRTAMHRAHELVRTFVPKGISLVDELIAGRHREAEREDRYG